MVTRACQGARRIGLDAALRYVHGHTGDDVGLQVLVVRAFGVGLGLDRDPVAADLDQQVVEVVAVHRAAFTGREHVAAADLLELAALGEGLGDGEDVDRIGVLVEADDRLVDRAVAIAVEVVRVEADVEQHRLDRRLGDHHRAEDGLLCLQVLGRDDGRSVARQLILSSAGIDSAQAEPFKSP